MPTTLELETRRVLAALAAALLAATPLAATPLAGADQGAVSALPRGDIARDTDARLEYISDFFVFVGREARDDGAPGAGLVFAFDANRGRDRAEYQAEHFGVLWVEGRGWVDLDVTQALPGDQAQLARAVGAALPTSDRAQVTGTAFEGVVVKVPRQQLELVVQPIRARTDRRAARDAFTTGSASAELRLGDRAFVGVAHHELTYLAGVNPLAKTYTDLFGDGFHGVYALVGTGDALRFHRSGGRLEPLLGRHSGYLAWEGAAPAQMLDELTLKTAKKSLGGLFRWPGRYELEWRAGREGARREESLRLDLKHRDTLINYVFGGVAIAIAQGELDEAGTPRPVLGFALIVL